MFEWKGFFWLVVDPLNEQGLRAYRSTDASTWTPQPKLLLAGKGERQDDGNGGSHADVVRKKVGSRQKKNNEHDANRVTMPGVSICFACKRW